MAIAVVTSNISPDGTDGTVDIAAPTGITIGDLLIAIITHGKSGGLPTVTTPGSSWTHIVSSTTDESATAFRSYYKVADSGDAAAGTFTFTLSSSQNHRGGILRITGQKSSGFITNSTATGSGSNTTSISFAGFTPTDANSLIIVASGLVGASELYSNWALATSSPTFTEHIDVGDNPSLGIASVVRPETTDTGNVTITQSIADHWTALAIAVAPAPAVTNSNFLAFMY